MTPMTIKDLENLQATLSEAGQDYQLELENGKIIVMGPSDIISSENCIYNNLSYQTCGYRLEACTTVIN